VAFLFIHTFLSIYARVNGQNMEVLSFFNIYKKVTHLDLLVDKYLYVLKYSLDNCRQIFYDKNPLKTTQKLYLSL